MACAQRGYTVEEFLAHSDGNFDIPDDEVKSDVEWLENEDFVKTDNAILPTEAAILHDEDDEELNLRTFYIVEADNSAPAIARGRPRNVSVDRYTWSSERSDKEVPSFTKAVGLTTTLQREALAVDFFLLFMYNRVLQNILRETNRFASQSLEAKHKDPATWKQVTMEELRAFWDS